MMSWVIFLLFTSLEFNKQQIEKGKNTFIPKDVKGDMHYPIWSAYAKCFNIS